jgi:hypothetical protein
MPHLGLLSKGGLELRGWRRGVLARDRTCKVVRLFVVVSRVFFVDQVVIGQSRMVEIDLVRPFGAATDGPERIALSTLDLGWIGAAPTLEV